MQAWVMFLVISMNLLLDFKLDSGRCSESDRRDGVQTLKKAVSKLVGSVGQ